MIGLTWRAGILMRTDLPDVQNFPLDKEGFMESRM